jgi:hypothetical protein
MNAKTLVQRFAAGWAAGLVILTGCQKKEEPAAPTAVAAPAKPAIVSAEKTSFEEVTAKLDKGGSFYLYLSTEKALSGLSNHLTAASNVIAGLPTIPSDGRAAVQKGFALLDVVVKESGISQISGLGMSSIAREKGFYYNKVIVHHYPGQDAGLAWTLFGKAAHPLQALDLLPESTAMAFASDLDVPLLWTSIQHAVRTLGVPDVSAAFEQAPAQFKEKTGADLDALLHSLAGEYGMFLTLDQHKTVTLPLGPTPLEIPNPGLCFFCKVNSDLIFNLAEQRLKANPMLAAMLTKVDEPGLKMRTVTIPLPIAVDVRPSLARVGDYLLLASSDTLVREIVAVKAGQKKGYKSSDEFKELSQGVPSEGNNFTLVSGALGSTVAQIQEKSMAGQNMDPEAMKTFQQLVQEGTNSGAFSVGANGPEGWEGIGNGNQGGQAVLILPAVAVAAIGAAMVLPAVAKAKEKAQEINCINNLRQIEIAKKQWAQEKNKQSTDTPEMSDLEPYLGGKESAEKIACPAGGTYTIGAVGEKPTCSVPGHALP